MSKNEYSLFRLVTNPEPYRFSFFAKLPKRVIGGLDRCIKKEIEPFVKKFSDLEKGVQEEAIRQASILNPQQYCEDLVLAWKAHNNLAREIDRFLTSLEYASVFILDEGSITRAIDLLENAFVVEDRKRVLSAGVKHILERWIDRSCTRAMLSTPERIQVLTIGEPYFWVLHDMRLAEYFYRRDSLTGSRLRQQFCVDFCASSEELMKDRLRHSCHTYDHVSAKQRIRKYRVMEKRVRSLALQGAYLALENEELKAIRTIIKYDNFVEYSFGYNLFGVPDLLLRKSVIALLVSVGILDTRDSVLLYTPKEILKGLQLYGK